MKNQIKIIVINGLIAFTTIFIVEHFSKFSNINSKTTSIEQITPFGTKILDNSGIASCVFSNVELKNYWDKFPYYANAVFKDFKFLVLIWVLFIAIYYYVFETKKSQN